MNFEYEKAMAYIEDTRKYGSVLGLDSIKRLLEGLGNPQNELKIIHVAGTNGKGSTSSYLAHILASAGYLVGRFNSPAVFEYREMIQLLYQERNHELVLHRENISESDFVLLINIIKEVCQQMVEEGFPHPTTFEIETALSFLYMKEKKVDFAIIEVGLGGRLDATNVIQQPICAVITSIGMDHMEFLGDTLQKIAREKAGIIKENTNVVVIEQDDVVMNVMKEVSQEKKANLYIAKKDRLEHVVHKIEGIEFLYDDGMGKVPYVIPLLGTHQVLNGLLALEVVEVLKGMGYEIKVAEVQKGLMATKWPGRFELLLRKPVMIIDGAHNKHAVEQLVSSLNTYFPNRKLIFIMGVLADKDYVGMLKLIAPYKKKIITVTPQNSRALSAKALYECITSMGLEGMDAGSIENGLQLALSEAEEDDIIVGFGSLSYLGKLKEEVNRQKK